MISKFLGVQLVTHG